MVIAVTLPASILSKRADSVEWNFLYADCKLLDIEFITMWESWRHAGR